MPLRSLSVNCRSLVASVACSPSQSGTDYTRGSVDLRPSEADPRARHALIRAADVGDVSALAALDASCAAEGSSGWSEGIYQTDLRPGSPNLILVCELLGPAPLTDHAPLPQQPDSQGAAVCQGYMQPTCSEQPLPQDTSRTEQQQQQKQKQKQQQQQQKQKQKQEQEQEQEQEQDQQQVEDRMIPLARDGTLDDQLPYPHAALVALAAGCEVAGEVSLTNLAVSRAWRGGGLGRRMVSELLRRLGAERCPTYLEARQDNAPAITLYDRLGFVVAGRRKRYYPDGCDGVIMIRQPAPLAPSLPLLLLLHLEPRV